MFNAEVFAKNIKQLRRQQGLTREMFAYKCGLSDESIRSYQACRQIPSTATLINMCSGLSVSANILLDGLYGLPTEQESIKSIESTSAKLMGIHQQLWLQTMELFTKCMSNSVFRLGKADWGSRLKLLREDAEISHTDFAALCGISSGTLSGFESGQRLPGIDTLLLICSTLHITPEFLLLSAPGYSALSDFWYGYLTPSQITSLKNLAGLFQQSLCKEG